MFWRVLVILSFVSSLTLLCLVLFREPVNVVASPLVYTNEVHTVHEVVVVSNVPSTVSSSLPVPDKKSDKSSVGYTVVRGDYQFHQCNALKWVDFDGDEFRLGYPSEYGRVVCIDRYFTMCVDDSGKCTYLRPGINEDDKKYRRRASPLAGSLQGKRADAPAAE